MAQVISDIDNVGYVGSAMLNKDLATYNRDPKRSEGFGRSLSLKNILLNNRLIFRCYRRKIRIKQADEG